VLEGGSGIVLAKLILASLLADFVLQPSWLVRRKAQGVGGLLLHGAIYFATSMGVGLGSWSSAYWTVAIALAVVHIGIDWGKIQVNDAQRGGYWPVAAFLVDQGLHGVSIVVLAAAFGFIRAEVLAGEVAAVWNNTRDVYVLSLYVAALFGGSIFVKLTTALFQVPSAPGETGVEGAGAYIGVVERLAITTLVALQQYGAVGFVLAAKSIARYKKIEEQKGFGEYYLIGTLTSSVIAILAGLGVSRILR